MGYYPRSITYGPGNGFLYVTNSGSCQDEIKRGCGYLTVIDGETNEIVANITSGFSYPNSIAYDSSNGNLYVTNSADASVVIINGTTNSIVGSINTGCSTLGIVYDPSNGLLYASDQSYNYSAPPDCSFGSVSVINATSESSVANLTGGFLDPAGLAYDPNNGDVYVADANCGHPAPCGNVSVINTTSNKVAEQIPLGFAPYYLMFDPQNDYLYASGDSVGIAIIDCENNSLIGELDSGTIPAGMALDPTNGYIYVTNAPSDSVSIVNPVTDQMVSNVTVGSNPISAEFDYSNGDVYVVNHASGTVSVLGQVDLIR